MQISGNLRKMQGHINDVVQYSLPLSDELLPLNPLIGSNLSLQFEGEINCIACGRKTKKSYSQGHCYPCSQRLASCDLCIMKPETCHYAAGTCREPEWGDANCMQDHFVYLSNTSGLKVGITRGSQIPTRWIDQGASQALPIFRVPNRLISGLVEVICKGHVADKTDWRKMLKGDAAAMDLAARRDELLELCATELDALREEQGDGAISLLPEAEVMDIRYPLEQYPSKIKSHNLDKEPRLEGRLMGIKGQYLIFDTAVINIRKYGGYRVTVEA